MSNTIKRLLFDAVATLVLVFIIRELFPKKETLVERIPQITTVHDTVHDTLKIVVPKKVVTSDTVNVVIRETIHDTVFITSDTSADVWPILNFYRTSKSGDTTTVSTFSLKHGNGANVDLYTKRLMITGMWAGPDASPRVELTPWPICDVTLLQKLKWSGIGGAAALSLRSLLGH